MEKDQNSGYWKSVLLNSQKNQENIGRDSASC
jgi:hypothetical protein